MDAQNVTWARPFRLFQEFCLLEPAQTRPFFPPFYENCDTNSSARKFNKGWAGMGQKEQTSLFTLQNPSCSVDIESAPASSKKQNTSKTPLPKTNRLYSTF
ncbi:hypothetical protein V492_00092 [Pseudogymnoascus sp. VKM F-4246]|nr:hypothetical protein V492_00092 [Pseudogymnoascus sp. VKM F-4246]